jgi:hypothetical protein
VAVVAFIALALALAWWHKAWRFPYSTQIGGAGDADEYAWFFSWMPFALGHGLNPLMSTFVNFPKGINLMWNTSVLLPSLVMSPVTVIWGAALSYNVVVTSAPVLATTAAFVAFRRWAGRLPSLAGALVFGFSPFMAAQAVGHLAQVITVSEPVILILADRLLVVQRGRPVREGLLLGLVAVAQLLTGEEILAMEGVTAAFVLAVLCLVNRRSLAARWHYASRGLLTAAGTFVVLAAPFLGFQYLGSDRVQNPHPANTYVTDLLNFVVPTNITRLAPSSVLSISQHFTGNGSEDGGYIGIPLVVFIVFTLYLARKRGVTWAGLAIAAGAGVLSMGSTVHVDGTRTRFYLPGWALAKLPLLHNLLPDRFAAVMFLGVGLLVAIGLEELKRLGSLLKTTGAALAVTGLAFLCPIPNYPASASPLFAAFDTGWVCPARPPGAFHPPVVLVLPAINELNLRWQAESKFCYVMPSDTGMTGTNSGDKKRLRMLLSVGDPGDAMPALTPAVRQAAATDIESLGITEIVVPPESPAVPDWTPQGQAQVVVWVMALLGQAPQQSLDPYISYVWRDLPPVSDIASGHVPKVTLATKAPPGRKPR